MNPQSAPATKQASLTVWERWASLLGRIIILFSMIYVPLVFFTWTWRHYHVPKVASFQFLVMMLTACWGIIAVRRRMVRSSLATPAAVFFMVVMVSTLVAVNLTEAWETVTFIAACMVFMVLIPKFMTRYKDFVVLAYLLGIMCLMVDIYALAQWFDWQGWADNPDYFCFIRKLTPKPVSFMGNENYAAEFLNMTLPVCFAMMICFRRKPAQLIFYTLVTLLNAIVMVYIDCNASFAGFMVAIPIATVLMIYFKAIPVSRRIGLFQVPRKVLEIRFRKLMVLAILGLSIFATIIATYPNSVRTKMASMASWMDVDGDLIPDGVAPIVFRLQCMDAAARNIMDSPILGIGAGNFKIEHPLYESQLERKVLGEETLARKVHNDHLYHAVEFGVLGLFSWYWIIAATVFAIICSLRLLEFQSIAAVSENRKTSFYDGIIYPSHVREFYFYLQWGILTGLLVAFVSCAFGHTFVISSSAVIFWLLAGVSVAIYQNLHFASRGIRNHLMGVTPEPVNPIQRSTRWVPGFVWWYLFFILLLPFGALNTYQLIGETWLRQGMSERDSNNYYGMFKCFQESMKIYPYQMETFYILGRYYIDAVMDVETESYNRKDLTNDYIQGGLRFSERRKYNEEGIAILQADIYMNPNYKWAHNNLGVLYDRYYDLIKPEKEDNVGQMFNITPDPEQAIAVMEASKQTYYRVLDIDKEQIYAHFNLGLGAIKMHDYAKAIEPLNRALITDPSRIEIYKYLSNCFCFTKSYKRALRAAEKYLEKMILLDLRKKLRTNQDNANYQQIMVALRNADYGKAVTLARLLMQFDNRDVYDLYLAVASEVSNDEKNPDPELAMKALDMAEKVNASPRPENYLWHAKIYEKLGRYDKAAESVEEYLRLVPSDDQTRYSLMLLYVQLEDLSNAQKVMSALVSTQPENWAFLITYARLMISTNTPWQQVFPYVERAIQLGGDEAKGVVIEDQPGNLILPYVKEDPRILNLLGPSFLPAEATSPIGGVIPADATPPAEGIIPTDMTPPAEGIVPPDSTPPAEGIIPPDMTPPAEGIVPPDSTPPAEMGVPESTTNTEDATIPADAIQPVSQ